MMIKLNKRSMFLASLVTAWAMASGAQAQELKQILRQAPNVAHGAELFRNCVACHGADGLGTPDGNVPVIAGQYASVIAKQLIDYRHSKRWDLRMEGIAARHSLQGAQDIADVAAHAEHLMRGGQPGVGKGSFLENGAAQYAKRCSSCHGDKGEGSAKKLIPKLAGQHYEYLLRQMYDAVDGRRPNLSSAHVRLLKDFVMEDFEGVADYMSRMNTP
jgi:cytochrome c553